MIKLNKQETEELKKSLPWKFYTKRSPMIEAILGVEVGESLIITEEEYRKMGYTMKFKNAGASLVQASTYQNRNGHRSRLFGRKFSTRMFNGNLYIFRLQ